MLGDELIESHGVKVVTIAADLARDGEFAKLATTLRRRRLAIDILVDNAGINDLGLFEKMDPAANPAIIRLNIAAATGMMSYFIPPMVAHGHGRVLNMASASAFVPVPFMAT